MTYDEFFEQHKPIDNHIVGVENAVYNGKMFETFGEEYREIIRTPKEKLWTIVETDTGMVLLPGYHYVNRMGYFITEIAWNQIFVPEQIQINYFENGNT